MSDYAKQRIAGTDPDSRIRQLEENLERRTNELREYIAVQEVLVAAGLVSKEKIDQAHAIVQKLS